MDGKQRVIANISNIPLDIRKNATITGKDGKPDMHPDYYGKVVEMIGQEFGKNGKLGSARIKDWRTDRQKESCKLTAEDIKPKGR